MTGSSSGSTRRAARSFVRRDRAAETAAQDAIRQDGLVQMRMATGQAAKGRLVFVFRGRDAAEAWQGFVAERLPALQALGWRNQIDSDFGPRLVDRSGCATCGSPMRPKAAQGSFSLDFGIEIDGARHPLLPILHAPARARRHGSGADHRWRGGHQPGRRPHPEAAGRPHRPPAGGDGRPDRGRRPHQRRHDGAGRRRGASRAGSGGPGHHALAGRRHDHRACRAVPRQSPTSPTRRCQPGSRPACGPISSRASTGCSICGRTASAGCSPTTWGWARPRRPSPISSSRKTRAGWTGPRWSWCRPAWCRTGPRNSPGSRRTCASSCCTAWTATRSGGTSTGVHVVITTYTVLARDIEDMAGLPWHMVVLDEAQAIKSPDREGDARGVPARHAPPAVPVRHADREQPRRAVVAVRLPDAGPARSRKSFNRRFRTPIEKDGDPVRRGQLAAAHPAVHPAPHQIGGGDRTAAEAHHPAPHHPGAGAARAVRDDPRHDA